MLISARALTARLVRPQNAAGRDGAHAAESDSDHSDHSLEHFIVEEDEDEEGVSRATSSIGFRPQTSAVGMLLTSASRLTRP